MKNIIKKRSFKIDLFGATIHMYMCKDSESILTVANRIIRSFKEDPVNYEVAGLTFQPDLQLESIYIFLSPENLDVNTITHETQHVICYIKDHYGIDEKNDSNEVLANIAGYVNEKVFAFIISCGLPISY